MNFKVALLFLVSVSLTTADSVLDLTDDDFVSRIKDIDAVLVLFHDAWCTFCGEVLKEFDEAAKLVRGINQQFSLARVNCNEGGKQTCLDNSIELNAYPIMKIFRKGIMGQEYNGSDDADSIVKFMIRQYGLASAELSNLVEFEKFLRTDEPKIIGFFENDSDLKKFFLEYADEYKADYRFGHSSANDVLTKYNEKNSIVLFRAPQFHNKFEPNSLTFKGDLTRDELTHFIKKNRHGLVGHRLSKNVQDFEYPNVIAYYAVDYVNNLKKTNYWRNRILQVAKENTDYKFAISSSEEFRLELEQYGHIYGGEKPIVAAHDKDDRKFKMTSEFSVENLKQFVTDVKQGKIEPFKKSLPIPSSNDDPVKIAVAKNFDEIVINNGKDTFIEFYAPWCRYCKDLEPTFDELGVKMVDEDVEIVKFDGTNNEVPEGFNLQGYPSIFWLPKDFKDKPLLYREGNNLERFIKYIAKHATNELKNYDRNGETKIKKFEL